MPQPVFLILGAIILIGFFGHLFFRKTRIPESIFMLMTGLLIGPVLGLVDSKPFLEIGGFITTLALIIILLDSGLKFDIFRMIRVFPKTVLFTIITFFTTTILVGSFMHFVVGWPFLLALLMGVVSSGTTTVTVSHLVSRLSVPRSAKELLVLESIINDITIVTAGVIIVRLMGSGVLELEKASYILMSDVIVGLALGFLFAFVWLYLLDRMKQSSLKFVFTIGMLFMLHDTAEIFNGSGPIAVLIFSLMIGNFHRIFEKIRIRRFSLRKLSASAVRSIRNVQNEITFFVKAFFFVFLGVIFSYKDIGLDIGIIVASLLFLVFAGRLISSQILSAKHPEFKPYRLLISIMMPRGFVATVVALLPIEKGIAAPGFAEIILLMIIVTTVLSTLAAALFESRRK